MIPKEEEQFKSYIEYMNQVLSNDISVKYSVASQNQLNIYNIINSTDALENVDITNADKKLKNLYKQLPSEFERLLHGKATGEQFYPSACAVLKFVYRVRCNLFHGRKTKVKLMNKDQQHRLLIYASILIAANSLLFEVVPKKNIGWKEVEVDLN